MALGIGLPLAAMSLDEMTRIHERLPRLYGLVFDEAPLPNYIWLMLGIPIAVAVIVAIVVMIHGMPAQPRALLLVGLIVFFAGAVGMELVQALTLDGIGQNSWAHFALWHIEELLELLGAGLMVAASVSAAHEAVHRYGRSRAGGTAG